MTQEKKKRTKSEWLHSNQRITCYFLRFLSLLCPWRGVGRSLSTNLNEVRHKFHLNLFRSSPSFPSALPSRSPLSFPFTCNLHTCPCNLYPCLQIARAQTLVYFVYFPISWSSPFCVSAYPSPSILLFYSILFVCCYIFFSVPTLGKLLDEKLKWMEWLQSSMNWTRRQNLFLFLGTPWASERGRRNWSWVLTVVQGFQHELYGIVFLSPSTGQCYRCYV